jgi:hypothetical protein
MACKPCRKSAARCACDAASQFGGLDLAYLLGLDEPSLRKEWIALAVLRLTTSLNPVKNATGSSFTLA